MNFAAASSGNRTASTLRTSESIAFGIRAVRAYPRLFIGSSLLLITVWALLEITVAIGSRLGSMFNVAAHVVFVALLGEIAASLIRGAMQTVQGIEPSLRVAIRPRDTGLRLVIGLTVYLVVTVLGLALLLAPGMWFAARYSLFPFILASGDGSLRAAYEHSAASTRDRIGRMMLAQLALLTLNASGAAMLGIGFLITLPISTVAAAHLAADMLTSGAIAEEATADCA